MSQDKKLILQKFIGTVGISSFRQIRQEQRTYIDKTGLLEELLAPGRPAVTLITRPRRFGKTLALSMLNEFFNIQKESSSLFAGLAISKNRALCAEWMNTRPVIPLSLKDMGRRSYARALETLSGTIAELVYVTKLWQSEKLEPQLKKKLTRLLESDEHEDNEKVLAESLRLLTFAMYLHWGKKAILLLDEYDVPVHAAEHYGYYENMRDFLRVFFGRALKDNEYLEFAVITGCLHSAKESICTGIPNLACYTIDDTRYADAFGFTREEVNELLTRFGLTEKAHEIAEWYDGYYFGNSVDIYCPWDIIKYLSDIQDTPNAQPKPYWIKTSDNAIVRDFLKTMGSTRKHALEQLLRGEGISAEILDSVYSGDASQPKDMSEALPKALSDDMLWTLFYATGYVTRAKNARDILGDTLGDTLRRIRLIIPNKEITMIFEKEIRTWFSAQLRERNLERFFTAFWDGNEDIVSEELSHILSQSIISHDDKEAQYHGIVTDIFLTNYIVRSNAEQGLAWPDCVIDDGERAAIIGLKISPTKTQLQKNAEAALAKIAQEICEDAKICRRWAFAFSKKTCLALCQKKGSTKEPILDWYVQSSPHNA